MTDEANCGGCNVICSDTCVNGTCQQVGCPPNFTWCDSECADTTTDESNCGSCGNECQSGQVCVNGACTFPYTCSGTLSALGRWCDQNNGTVKDMTTGLVWLKDAGCMGYMDWYSAIEHPITNLRSGDCSGTLTDGSVWGDWRLPTNSELVGITVGDEHIRSSQMYFFTNVQSDYYWSSTTAPSIPPARGPCTWTITAWATTIRTTTLRLASARGAMIGYLVI